MYTIKPKEPCLDWLNSYFNKELIASKSYSLDEISVKYKLDQNESPFDWSKELKSKICDKMLDLEWNRYPSPYAEELIELVANYSHVSSENVILGPGSNHMICLLLEMFSQKREGKLVLARPSFPLYESFCRINSISYETWNLDDEYNYDLNLLPKMPEKSLLVFASPNNPVGNILKKNDLIKILDENPNSIIIADEAYYEFAEEPFTDLLEKYSNLILLRTLSKAMGVASLRLGYVLASKSIIDSLKKVTLPFLLNTFSIVASSEVLKSKDALNLMKKNIEFVRSERERMLEFLKDYEKEKHFKIYPSHANFLLLKCSDQNACNDLYEELLKNDILVRNVSRSTRLESCLRLTVGLKSVNDHVLSVFNKIYL